MAKVYTDPIKNAEKRKFHVYVAESATLTQPHSYFLRFNTEPLYGDMSQNSTHTALTPVKILQLLDNGEWIRFRSEFDVRTVKEILIDYRQVLLEHGNGSQEAEAFKELLSAAIDILQDDEDVKRRFALSTEKCQLVQEQPKTLFDLLSGVVS